MHYTYFSILSNLILKSAQKYVIINKITSNSYETEKIMKLDTKKTFLVGFAFLAITAFGINSAQAAEETSISISARYPLYPSFR